MEVTVNAITDSKFEVAARGHRIICDQPLENGGLDEGVTPPEFLLASLGTCAAYYAAQYLKARGLLREELRVRVNAEKAEQPARLSVFQIEIDLPIIEERNRAGILRAVKTCLIHNTMLGSPRIEVSLASSVEAAPALP